MLIYPEVQFHQLLYNKGYFFRLVSYRLQFDDFGSYDLTYFIEVIHIEGVVTPLAEN